MGAILYEMVTGEHVGPAMRRPREIEPSLPEALEALIGKAIIGDRAHRPADLGALASAMYHVAPQQSIHPPEISEERLDASAELAVDVKFSMLPPNGSRPPVTEGSGVSHLPQSMGLPPLPLFDAADQVCGSLEMARGVIDSARLIPARPAAAAEESWVIATDLAEALAREGTPFHRAHQIAGKLVLESVKAGKKPSDWTAADLMNFSPEFTPDMALLLHPIEGMKTRELPGGTGPRTVAAALEQASARLSELSS